MDDEKKKNDKGRKQREFQENLIKKRKRKIKSNIQKSNK